MMAADMDEHETKIVNEFCHQLEKSKQLFNGLRDLPQYGHRQWQSYFGKTFDVYTKLWKFQQQHRLVLDHKYGLKRWQIGEIASKIGQLYYHYYLRTSETNYLNEAYSFYSAIRGRAYYSRMNKEDNRPDMMVKKLRYYARFIVVCLLLKKMKLVKDLVRELGKHVEEYTSTYKPEDQLEWSMVLSEIHSFIEADNVVNVLDMDSNQMVLSHRLHQLTAPAVDRSPSMCLSLQEILVVGNCSEQAKFSELTIDMFRMLQTLEREPQEEGLHTGCDTSPSAQRSPYENGDSNGRPTGKRENPHKYLLYKPTFSQLMAFLASGFKELPANGAMLLYLSADGCFSTPKHSDDPGYDFGGVVTNSKKELDTQGRWQVMIKDLHCFYPGDLQPFTRKPLFVIADSDNSVVFQNVPNYFGQTLVILMSPQYVPGPFQEEQSKGSLFTLFLHSPLMALCFVFNLANLSVHVWDKCQTYVDHFLTEAAKVMTSARGVDPAYIQFFGDDFLRLLLLRYVFCAVVLRNHRAFKGCQFQPRAQPALPESGLLDHPSLHAILLELATLLDSRHLLLLQA
ncbi:protein SCAI-like [Pollicipes pollicipes]|uniref:protein SCAI-like n=1 Tax=Pollicipes pollicipes TaxID=41117 RepID=UPI001884F9C9|nr:protein SCAI-like [Pollicipes pollicipes]XP_037079945.1 protein SCAI-like [Pollicipes pollicipes]XP_037079947.1 protein SCAI-like [Pollicipes pollicipes]XP_037079948.1 protein SCAI-like [Pollicipes pollicipes]XP_037079949.1 protein SCAI-like [Pollicipes pollicipes]XP_037079950.1 protein SCAI-like [Pollicipes pollicipes]XP_037079951.1 protein SCAI-like [Pollicipes pollicipes]XP_037079952.1 protein SCAI-like [Pollicipes pollicipes]